MAVCPDCRKIPITLIESWPDLQPLVIFFTLYISQLFTGSSFISSSMTN